MSVIQKSTELISQNRLAEALALLTEALAADPGDAGVWYLRGKVNWRLGRHGAATSDYEHAVALSPDSPARHALEMARDVTDFFNPDMFNP